MIQLFLRWLRPDQRRSNIAVRPSRALEIPVPYDVAFDRCKNAAVELLGAALREEDRTRGYLESSPGLTFSERICFTVQPVSADATRVTVESRRIAGSQLPPESTHIARVTEYLLRS